ncbi:hypothetical protein BDY19DRAFT_1035754 [Irpex rosettiformis]|uniref:Uncharacterized protein n=1 Tax=Irpex rosettiformis TaxID=378272 RepID=A0ACB8U9G4_9APHY|nr:hypothetical protein BDY19DRAFT_1035754 [Irpex rosettiformis]
MAQAPSWTWVCGPWGPSIARRPCPYRGNSRFVWASAHAPSQYFPVLLRPSGWAGHFFFFWLFSWANPNPNKPIFSKVIYLSYHYLQ